jgi:outer membrane protein OmpA-like peptidoglycan-associated protein
MKKLLITATCIMLIASGTPSSANAQLGKILKKTTDAAKEAAKAIKDTAGKVQKPETPAPAAAPSPSQAAAPAATPAKKDAKIWENYDFVPGVKPLFYTDFSEDRVGNFARGLKYVSGPLEIVERDDVKMLRATAPGTLLIPVGRKLPQRFTLEIDLITPPAQTGGFDLIALEGGPEMDRGTTSAEIDWNTRDVSIIGGGQGISTSQLHLSDAETEKYQGKLAHIRILMDTAYFKMYANEKRLYNIPELAFRRDSVIRLQIRGGENDEAVFVTSIRVAESETDVLYDALKNKGRWATQGILFATGKAELQPESRPVLKEIASTMKKYSDLKILIEGHTDNVGSAASNLALSDARAAAVKAALVADYGVGAERITTKGFGDTKPSAPNATALGRSQNRRVEIVKQ